MRRIHARARPTQLICPEIRSSEWGVVELAEHYNISRATTAKPDGYDWLRRFN